MVTSTPLVTGWMVYSLLLCERHLKYVLINVNALMYNIISETIYLNIEHFNMLN